jgi:hypothetical protein
MGIILLSDCRQGLVPLSPIRHSVRVTQRDIEWNTTNFLMQAALDDDPAFEGIEVERDPIVLVIVVEPGHRLTATSHEAIERARSVLPLRVVEGKTPKAVLNEAKARLDEAGRTFTPAPESKGFGFGIDWRMGRVRMTGDVADAERLARQSGVDMRLVLIEDGPGARRLVGRRADA